MMPVWSRRHYEKIAGIISKMKPCESLDKMIDELETVSNKDVGIVREKLHHYRWLASKLLPSLYGDKQEVIQDTKITIQWQQPEQMKVVEADDR